MNRQAWIAWLMILLQASLFWYLSSTVVFPLVVVAISLPAVISRRQWALTSARLQWIDLGFALLCTLKWYLAPHDPSNITGFVMYPLVHAAAQFFLLVQVARLWGRRRDRPLPVYLPMLAILVFICLGDVDVTRRQRRMYQHATLALVGLICAYDSSARKSLRIDSNTRYRWVRPTVIGGVLLATAWGARAGNAWLLEQWSDIERYVLQATHTRRRNRPEDAFVGFSGVAPVGSIQLLKSQHDEEVALRVLSQDCPHYLRGASFDQFLGNAWEYRPDWEPIMIARNPAREEAWRISSPAAIRSDGAKRFLLRPIPEKAPEPITMYREADVDRFTFLPKQTVGVETSVNNLMLDRHGVVSAANLPPSVVMTAWISQSPQTTAEPLIQPEYWTSTEPLRIAPDQAVLAEQRLCELPISIHPLVVERAATLFANCQTAREKIDVVRSYFSQSRYQAGLRATHGRDPLTQFILDRLPGHCEAFATGTAILLRLGGVPCRYVTGFTGGDFNPIGRYWVVRQRNAHAWVEAYLPEEGWITVDTTPDAGIPGEDDRFGWWQLWDEINLRGQMIRATLAAGSLKATFTAIVMFLQTLLTTIPGWFFTGGLLFLILRQITFRTRQSASMASSPVILQLQSLREELDRLLQRQRWQREPAETLHQFAARLTAVPDRAPLQAAAEWYLRYAAVRYHADENDLAVESLVSDLRELHRQFGREPK